MASTPLTDPDCPFCAISAAYPPSPSPIPSNPDPTLCQPECHLILSTPHVLCFLDILPISPGHILLTTRPHHRLLSHIPSTSPVSAALGYWMPLLSRALSSALDIEDWNIVQNNGHRAAQVVDHVHFHFIPRYAEGREEGRGKVGERELRSWRMFGKGQREELDDEEGVVMAKRIRGALAREVEEAEKGGGKGKL